MSTLASRQVTVVLPELQKSCTMLSRLRKGERYDFWSHSQEREFTVTPKIAA